MSLDEISRVTRIPIRSLERLELGEFEDLPADVFVRGFLRSYAQCVGLDGDDTVRRYARCGLVPAPVASKTARELLRQCGAETDTAVDGEEPAPRRRTARGTEQPRTERSAETSARVVAAELIKWMRGSDDKPSAEALDDPKTRDGIESAHAPDAPVRSHSATHGSESSVAGHRVRARTFFPEAFSDEDSAQRRGSLTLAVLILVIVATLTMSYLLRRPSYSGDGITQDDSRPSADFLV